MSRQYDLVMFNQEAFSYDLAERGLNQKMFCERVGMDQGTLSKICHGRKVSRSTVEKIEMQMLAERGSYTIEIDDDSVETPAASPVAAAPNPEIGYIRTNMNSHFNEVEKRLEAVEKAIREIPSQEDELERILSKMNSMIILMNRMLEMWGYTKKGVINGTEVSKS